MRRRMLSLLLAIVMVLGMLPVTALAAEQPFLSISVNGTDLSTDKILFKTLFDLGSLESSYSYVHEDVPYYHVTVPCGTEYVDVTYSADTNIFDSGSDAYGYATELEVDAVSSATVKGRTFKDAYTLNDDGTQTVKTPVKGYTFDENGNGMAITLEEEGGTYEAVCLFTFEYDGENHVYTSSVTAPTCQTQGYTTYTCTCGDSYVDDYVDIGSHSYENGACTVCGAEDPDYVVHTHSYTTVVTAPTCTEKGYTTYTCECGDTYTSDETSALGHSYVAGLCSTCGEADPAYVAPTVTAFFSVSHDDTFRDDCASGDVMALKQITVPYFDLALYGLEDFYFSSEEYGDDGDNLPGSDLLPGTAEYADGKVTMLHLFIYATEVCYLGVDPADAGQGYLYDQGILGTEVLNISGSVGSSFLNNFWNQDLNLNYYLNYEYPLASEGWGSTSDQILLHDGDIVTVGHFTDWSFFNDSTSIFNYIVADNGTIAQGDEINLTLYHAGADMSGSYTTAHTVIDYCPDVYYAPFDDIPSGNVTEWTYLGTAESDGTLSVNTADMAPGEYIIALAGQYGAESTEAICSTPGGVIVTVEEAVSTVSPEQIDGVYQIGTAEELVWLAETVNGGETAISAVLTADIDLSNVAWESIGTSDNKFAGSFDGQGHTVTFQNSSCGLFGYVYGTSSAYAEIKNVTTDGTISATAAVGGIAGYVQFVNIANCVNRADISANGSYVSGITLGRNFNKFETTAANITNCANEGDISGSSYVAGILSCSRGGANIVGCSNTGNITGSSEVGGISGYLQGYKGTCYVTNCYNLGSISGSSTVGGLIGSQYNSVAVTNCYNAGESYYAISGMVYNATATITNAYYMGSASTESVPANNLHSGISAVAKTAVEMSSAEFAAELGSAFQQSCPASVLTWQTASAHTGMEEDGICDICGLGGDIKENYAVVLSTGEGYTINGDATATQGEAYTFTVTLTDGYEKSDNFTVKVNGEELEETDGTYAVENVSGPLVITVVGVQEIPDAYAVTLPEVGYGYRVNGEETAVRGEDYTFTVSFVDGFRAGADFCVKANGVALTAVDGVYTIANVTEAQVIAVSGVEMIPYEETTDIRLTITKGEQRFYTAEETGTTMLDLELTVPYFDIALYGLEGYYYNPYCYVDENGNAVAQSAGNIETAYGNITMIHAFIYTTEVYYLGMDEADAGKGISKTMDTNEDGISDFDEVLSWTGGVGSSFMDLWDHGTNLNYYLNYTYPLGREGWGLTSDQQLLVDGDIVSMHLIEDTMVSGSNFAVFTANDADKTFSKTEDQLDRGTVTQGETIALTLYQTQNGMNYTTDYLTVAGQELYWVNADEVSEYVSDWNRTAFGAMEEGSLVTDSTGTITIDTTGLESGTYYIGALGGLTEGGSVDNAGFVSRGGETGAAFFELTVLEGEETELLLGDLTGDGNITATDAAMVYRYINNTVTINQMQITAADVNEDGEVTATDAAMIYRYINNTLNAFSDEE